MPWDHILDFLLSFVFCMNFLHRLIKPRAGWSFFPAAFLPPESIIFLPAAADTNRERASFFGIYTFFFIILFILIMTQNVTFWASFGLFFFFFFFGGGGNIGLWPPHPPLFGIFSKKISFFRGGGALLLNIFSKLEDEISFLTFNLVQCRVWGVKLNIQTKTWNRYEKLRRCHKTICCRDSFLRHSVF